MRTLRRQPSIPDLTKGRGLYVDILSETNPHFLRPSSALRPNHALSDKSNQSPGRQSSVSPSADHSKAAVVSCREVAPRRIESSHACCDFFPEDSNNSRPAYLNRSLFLPPDLGGRLAVSDDVIPPAFARLRRSSTGSTSDDAWSSEYTGNSPVVRRLRLSNRSPNPEMGGRKSAQLVSTGTFTRAKSSSRNRHRYISKWGKEIRSRTPSSTPKRFLRRRKNLGTSAKVHADDRALPRGPRSADYETRSREDLRPESTCTFGSATSSGSSLYPASSRSSSFCSLPLFEETEPPRFHRSLRPSPVLAIHTSEPSPFGSDSSPLSSPGSLPESLAAEVIDLTEHGRKLSSAAERKTPSLYATPVATPTSFDDGSQLALSAQNTFYIPPVRPIPALRAVKSVEPGSLRRAFNPSGAQRSAARLVEPCTIGSSSDLAVAKRGLGEDGSLTRPSKTFALCSWVHMIDPLPAAGASPCQISSPTSESKSPSPWQTASTSLRVVFGRNGFVARKLSGAFERHLRTTSPEGGEVVLCASTEKESDRGEFRRGRGGDARRPDQAERNRQWRQDVLSQAVSLSLSSVVNRAYAGETTNRPEPKKPGSSWKPRPRIPEEFLLPEAALRVDEMGRVERSNSLPRRISVRTLARCPRGAAGENASDLPTSQLNGLEAVSSTAAEVLQPAMSAASVPTSWRRSIEGETGGAKAPSPSSESPATVAPLSDRRETTNRPRETQRRSRLLSLFRPAKTIARPSTQHEVHEPLPPVVVISRSESRPPCETAFITLGEAAPRDPRYALRSSRSVLDRLSARDSDPGVIDAGWNPTSDAADRVTVWRESVSSSRKGAW